MGEVSLLKDDDGVPRVHFWRRYVRDTIIILEEGNLPHPRCENCILPQLFRAFAKFPATAGQSSSPAIIILPRYVNLVIDLICFP